MKPGVFWEPVLPGFEGPHAPVYCFLISHGGRHVLFDLGVRTDWESLAPRVVKLVKATTQVTTGEQDIASMLDNDKSDLGIRSVDIEAIIWSHGHFDHTGDPSRFPPQTELIVGPGVMNSAWPGYPSNPEGVVLDSDAAGRFVREVRFESASGAALPLKVGRFDAFDFFGDGSFYLLDAPGHAPGHMCALARVTANPQSFVFMGADACHHPGVLLPSKYLPLPRPTVAGVDHPSGFCYGGCPGDVLMHLAKWKTSPDEPFFRLTAGPMFPDHAAATDTVSKIQELDALGDVLIVLAHDDSLSGRLPLFPECVNGWQSQGLREATRWMFCKELESVKL